MRATASAYLYLGRGDYTILVGSKDAVAEFSVRIDRLDAAIPLHVDLAECDGGVPRLCRPRSSPISWAITRAPPKRSHAAGNRDAARRLRAGLLERSGRARDAAAELEALGDLTQAAELRASDDDHSASAALYEQSGNLAQAAAAHRAAGEWAEAARCYEEIYDYGNALECWREQGDEARQLDLLEKLGEYQDAAQIARALGDLDRAIRNLQLIDARHPDYRHVCRLIAEIVSERGDHELAVAKFDEALGPNGLEIGVARRAGELRADPRARGQARAGGVDLRGDPAPRRPAHRPHDADPGAAPRDRHGRRAPLERRRSARTARAATSCSRRSAAAAWASCTRRATSGSAASWR